MDVATSTVFVVMELLSGVTLEQRVAERGPCSAEETSEYVRQIAAGLEKAHGHVDRDGRSTPVVHRDLKPSNLFLAQRDDGSALVKILDFGAAKVWSQNTHASGVIRGTPAYMASEQAAGEPSSPATDIWSLGLIAFFLLTGKSYWLTVDRGGSQMQLFAEILSLPLAPASERARALGSTVSLGPGFDAWFARSVTRDVARRFASAVLSARELSQVLGVAAPQGQGSATLLETLDHAAVESTRGTTRGSRARVILSTLGLVLAGGGGIAATALWKPVSGTSEVPVSAAPSIAPPSPSTSITAEVPSPKPSDSAPSEASSAPRPSTSLGVAAPSSSASTKPNKDGKKRHLPNPPATPQEGPKPAPRDVYEQR